MKVRASKNVFDTEKSFEDFKLLEFSKDRAQFVPDLSLSCNECHQAEDEAARHDSIQSFLIKFKADQLSDPKNIQGGVEGMILPEDGKLVFQKNDGIAGFFRSVTENHYDLILNEELLEEVAQAIFNDEKKRRYYSAAEVEDYLIQNHLTPEWQRLLSSERKKNWKKYLKASLKRVFRTTYGELVRADLEKALELDPEGLKAEIKKLNSYGCFTDYEKGQIREALGNHFV